MKQPDYKHGGVRLYHGDCVEVMRSMAACSVDTIITDPPYHLTQTSRNGSARKPGTGPFGRVHVGERGFMGKTWDGGGIAFDPEMWATVLHVAKPGAFLLAFGGTRTFHRLACALEEAGWQVRDCIMWLYGSGFPKSLDVSKAIDRAAGAERKTTGISSGPNHSRYQGERYRQKRSTCFGTVQDQPALTAPATSAAEKWNGWGTGLKPAWEPIIVAMKPLEGTFARNALKHDVAGLNIGRAKIGSEVIAINRYEDVHKKGTFTRPGDASSTHAGEPFKRFQSPGRWPANLIHDGSDEVVKLFPQTGSSRVRIEQNSERIDHSQYRIKPAPGTTKDFGDAGSAARFFYCAKASRSERNAGLSGMPARKELIGAAGHTTNPTTGKPVVDISRANHHPTVKPLKLMEYLCKLTATPTGGTILDPFAGSGSTLIAAQNVGRKCIGIECDREYVRIAQARLRARLTKKLKGGSSKAA